MNIEYRCRRCEEVDTSLRFDSTKLEAWDLLVCSPSELWSYIRMVDLGNRDDYRKAYEAYMKRCK